ncbi:H4G protein, partial [Dromaius novaehollandiae]|nr:H4G protein [Dromaius novaehollandiae]
DEGVGLGEGGAKHHGGFFETTSRPQGRRLLCLLAEHRGMKCVLGLAYKETCRVLKVFLENVIQDTVHCTKLAKRKMMVARGVEGLQL